MRPRSDDEIVPETEAFDDALASIFAKADPFGPELAPGVERAVLLYPWQNYRFPADSVTPLSELSQKHGESRMYVAYSEVLASEAHLMRKNGYGPVASLRFPLTHDA